MKNYMRTFYSYYFSALEKMPLCMHDFQTIMCSIFKEYNELDSDTLLEILISLDAPLYRNYITQHSLSLQGKDSSTMSHNHENVVVDLITKNIHKDDARFCFVDIESTSSNVETGQIIEIGALIAQDGKILDTFSTFVYSAHVPEEITHLTHIESYMLKDAPQLQDVLHAFKNFLGDCIFVAHNVGFDYNFISESMQLFGMPPLLNARLCTLELSRKVLLSKKHALPHLNKMLGINTGAEHRAFADALTSFELFKICSLSLPYAVNTAQDLIDFTKGKINYPKRATSNTTLNKTSTKYTL